MSKLIRVQTLERIKNNPSMRLNFKGKYIHIDDMVYTKQTPYINGKVFSDYNLRYRYRPTFGSYFESPRGYESFYETTVEEIWEG